jgi:hypothetical protein
VSECHNSLRVTLSVLESTETDFWDQKRLVFSTKYTVWKILSNKTSCEKCFCILKKHTFFDDYKVSEWDNSWKIWIDQTEIETLTLKKSHFQSGPRNIHSNFPLMYFKVIKKISFIWCKKVLFTICFRHYFLILCSLYWNWQVSVVLKNQSQWTLLQKLSLLDCCDNETIEKRVFLQTIIDLFLDDCKVSLVSQWDINWIIWVDQTKNDFFFKC